MSWPLVKLEALCHVVTKGTTPTSIGYNFAESGIPFLRIQNLFDSTVSLDDVLYISPETHEALKRSIVRPGDLLITIAGTIGRVAIVPNDFPESNCNQAIAILRLGTDKVWPPYLLHWITTKDAMSQIAGKKVTATISNLSLGQIKELEIPLPPLEEQKRIAAILDKADAIRQKRQQAIQLADDFLRSVFLEMFGDPVTNPKGWEVKSLQELANRVTKGESPKWQGFGYQDEGVRFVTSENVLWGTLDDRLKYISFEFHQKLKRSQLESNDLLINLVGASVGRACLVSVDSLPANINQAVAVISLDNSLIIPEIALLQILTESVQRVLLGNVVDAARANISLANIRELNILVPPIEKQQEILINLNKIKKTVAGQKCQNISMLFESLSQKAFSGHL